MTVTEDQARAGGCCICDDPCGGVDIDDEARARGVHACVIECAWCMNGCPAPNGEECFCAKNWHTRMNDALAQGRTDRSVQSVLESAPRGYPRPLTNGLPTPWIARTGDLGDVDAFRRACAVMLRLCQVCGLPLGDFATVYWRPGDVVVVDGAALHPQVCAPLAERHCPALRGDSEAGKLRKATVMTRLLRPVKTGPATTDEGMPRAYEVPV